MGQEQRSIGILLIRGFFFSCIKGTGRFSIDETSTQLGGVERWACRQDTLLGGMNTQSAAC